MERDWKIVICMHKGRNAVSDGTLFFIFFTKHSWIREDQSWPTK